MKTAKYLLSFGLSLAATGLMSCSIPKPECTVGQTGYLGGAYGDDYLAFATRYVVVANPKSCPVMRGEIVGVQSYHPATADGKDRDFSKTTIAISTQNLGELAWLTEDTGLVGDTVQPISLGAFAASDPDASNMCQVPTTNITDANSTEVTPSRVVFPGGVLDADATIYAPDPDNYPQTCTMDEECAAAPNALCRIADGDTEGACVVPIDLPATDMSYQWSNLAFYVTAAAPGTQFTADVDVTINGCTATYKAVGMWPAVNCTGFTIDATDTSPAVVVTNDDMCNPDPSPGRGVGSGINPDFGPTFCDTSFAVTPVIDAWYPAFVNQDGVTPLSVPRCALKGDEIPALGGYSSSTSTQ